MVSRQFGIASPAGIYRALGEASGGHEGECIVKKCLKYQCEKVGLVCILVGLAFWPVARGNRHRLTGLLLNTY